MANKNAPNGFRPAKSLVGAPWTALVREYEVEAGRNATNNSGDIYIGDIVNVTAGYAVPVTTSGDAVLGVVVAVGTKNSATALNTDNTSRYFDPDNLSKRYLAYNEAGWVGVVPVEAVLFSVQSDVALVTGEGADIAIVGTGARGNRTTGNSTQYITTALNSDVTVVEQITAPDNDPTAVNARYLVKFNLHANAIN